MFPDIKDEKELMKRMRESKPGDRAGITNCCYCGKPLKKVDDYSYKFDCDCVKKYPHLKDMRLCMG